MADARDLAPREVHAHVGATDVTELDAVIPDERGTLGGLSSDVLSVLAGGLLGRVRGGIGRRHHEGGG